MFYFSDKRNELKKEIWTKWQIFCLFKNLIYMYTYLILWSVIENLDVLLVWSVVWVEKHCPSVLSNFYEYYNSSFCPQATTLMVGVWFPAGAVIFLFIVIYRPR